jgi:phage protein D
MLNPFIVVRVGEQDLAPYITSFDFEDCTEEDDLLSLSLNGLTLEMLESDAFQVGKDISFQFGYRGGAVSPLRTMRISDITPSYDKTITATLKALDYGQLLKKQPQGTVWQQKTASQIVTAIGQKYGLDTSEVQPTSFIYPHLAQGQKTDFEMIQYLAERETNGSFHFFIRNNFLFFKRKDLNQQASHVFTIGDNIISFKPSLKDSQKQDDKFSTTNINTLTGKETSATITAQNAKDQFSQGNYTNQTTDKKATTPQVPVYDLNGNVVKPTT